MPARKLCYHLGQARLAYMRDRNVDEGQGNGFRVRAHRLGDFMILIPFLLVLPPCRMRSIPISAIAPGQMRMSSFATILRIITARR